jgi:endonuclease/exonuclease/phosphatase family metal-dependent hydrolase
MAHRFTAMTANLWNTQRWPEREAPLRALLHRAPDLLCVQELRPALRTAIDAALRHHARVEDPFPGWAGEGNIWWDTRCFEVLAYGAADHGAVEAQRRLFWARLRHLAAGRELVVATVHLTWTGGTDEPTTGLSPRPAQARAIVAALAELAADDPCLLMGDLNDPVVPVRTFRAAGFADAWSALGVQPVPTFPAFPVDGSGSRRPPLLPASTLDWQFHRGPVRPVMTEVVDQPWRGVAPSDHRPVMTLYELA